MELVILLDQYIEKLDNASTFEQGEVEALIEDITRVFINQDELSGLYLDYYNSYDGSVDLMSDIRKLKAKLEYDKAVLNDESEKKRQQAETEREQRELEKLRLQVELRKGNITINNTNTNENHNSFDMSFNMARETINSMTALTNEEIEEIQKRINELEEIVSAKDSKSKKWSKVKEIIKWIADKGVDVGIALLPLVLKIS
ncbi:MAG: hypothetical protein DBY24_10475 [Prevotellaceae bacterium]|nr:MAG: hypothetical protein DBY24_10475 [Prevotellaceae bacterium]